ncbi:hypothetical protein ACJJI3_22910 [Microbulbifer sp. ZKSA004]|uniref:hypothetical protein n=1 Tax=Microbulbifer sp. ZKSA004 TaxID=3243389 RepID=UPI004039E473
MIRINGPKNRDWSEINFYDGVYHRKHSPEPFFAEARTLSDAIAKYCENYKVSIKEEEFLGEVRLLHKPLKKKKSVGDFVKVFVIRNRDMLQPEEWESFTLEEGDIVEIK